MTPDSLAALGACLTLPVLALLLITLLCMCMGRVLEQGIKYSVYSIAESDRRDIRRTGASLDGRIKEVIRKAEEK